MPEPDSPAFALNQRTAPHLGWAGFLDLAKRLGCVGVEPRTDLGRPVFDGLDAAEAGRMAAERGLRLVGLSEVYPFDDWNQGRRGAVAALVDLAAASGAETVSLIPRVDGLGPRIDGEAARHEDILAEVLALAKGTGVVPLVEPIGFPGCSIRHQKAAAAVIGSLGAEGRIGLLHDTFQHALAADPDFATPHVRLVHVSGFAGGGGPLTQADDGERGLIDAGDRTGAVAQMRRLRDAGYRGTFSFECTTPRVQNDPGLEAALAASIAFIRERLA